MNELVPVINQLLESKNSFDQITSRKNEGISFYTFDSTDINKIAQRMPEINRAIRTLGRSNTQTTNKLMTITMLNGNSSPYRHLRQCITQIEDRRSALNANLKTLTESKILIEALDQEISLLSEELELLKLTLESNINLQHFERIQFKKNILQIETQIKLKENDLYSKQASISDSMCYIEGCLKEIASFQEAYKQIKENNNIPDNWDEIDVELEEVPFHVKEIFLHGYRDLVVHGSIGMGTIEYMNQFGIHPNVAKTEIETYIESTKIGNNVDAEHLENWLKEMSIKYGQEFKKVLKSLGITEMVSDWCLYKDRNKAIKE